MSASVFGITAYFLSIVPSTSVFGKYSCLGTIVRCLPCNWDRIRTTHILGCLTCRKIQIVHTQVTCLHA